ncbi:MAG: glycine cleavage system protein R [Acidimicrobiales bacterium]
MPQVVLTAIGADRPGIVAGVTQVLLEAGCNIEDSSMTNLGGCFAMMLAVNAPTGINAADLEARLTDVAGNLDLTVSVREMETSAASGTDGPDALWTVSVHGVDHPGIVAGLTGYLAEEQVNILDLRTRLIGDPGAPVYVMALDVALPSTVTPDRLESGLRALAESMGVACRIHQGEADVF